MAQSYLENYNITEDSIKSISDSYYHDHGILSLMNKPSYQINPFIPLYTEITHHKLKYDPISTGEDVTISKESVLSSGDTRYSFENPNTTFNLDDITISEESVLSSKDKNFNLDVKYMGDLDCHRHRLRFLDDITISEKSVLSSKDTRNSFETPDTILTAVSEVESITNGVENYDLSQLKVEEGRIFNMISLRYKLADSHLTDQPYYRPMTYNQHPNKFIYNYTKGLPHNGDGFVDANEMIKLIEGIQNKDHNLLSKIKLGSNLKLINTSAAWSYDIIGKNSNSYRYSKLPHISSNRMAVQMTELYCMSLCRDIPFSEYKYNDTISDCCSYLNNFPNELSTIGKVDPYNIFRGPMNADLQGSYISQFLYRDINICGFTQKQQYDTFVDNSDSMKKWDTAISAQNGIIKDENPRTRKLPRYIITGRDLAHYVKSDDLCQTFYNTHSILLDMKVPMNPGIAKLPTEDHLIDLGKYDVQATIGMIARNSLLAAWYVKWNSLFLRPEAYGIEVERVYRTNRNKYGVSLELLKNPVLEAIRSKNKSSLLTQVYPEGSPLYPSSPSSHAVVAGACVTALKFFFDMNHEIEVYEPDKNGENLIKTGKIVTIGDELNKLACNLSIGRNWAGVNYYMDTISGLKRGEKVAISCLQELIYKYPMQLSINLCGFNNCIINIHN